MQYDLNSEIIFHTLYIEKDWEETYHTLTAFSSIEWGNKILNFLFLGNFQEMS